MTSRGLDALVSDGALLALEAQAYLADAFEHQPSWGVDLAEGTFTFSGESTPSQTFGVQPRLSGRGSALLAVGLGEPGRVPSAGAARVAGGPRARREVPDP